MSKEKRKTKQQRRGSPATEELFRFMVESVKDYAIFATDVEGRIVSWNVGAERIFGYTEAEIINRHGSILFTPEDIEEGAPEYELTKALADGHAEDERWHLRKDNSRFWASGMVTPLLDEAGNLRGFVKVARDNTRRMRNEEKVQVSETRFRTLIEQFPLSLQILSPDGRTSQVNRAWEELWGVRFEQIQDYNMLEDEQLVAKGVMPYIRKGFAGEATAIPPIMYDPNETIPNRTKYKEPQRWVRAFIYPVKDEAGRVREVVLMHEDITEQKHVEDELRESEERYRTVAETASDAIITINEESTVLFANPAVEQIFGYQPDELLGQSLTMLMPDYLRHLHREGLKHYLETNERHISWQAVELPGLHRSGREISLELSFGEFKTADSHLFTGIVRDITQRKRAERRQESQHAITRVLAESSSLKEATARILQSICESMGWTLGAVWRVDREALLLRCVDVWHLPAASVAEFEELSRRSAFKMGEGLPGLVWQNEEAVWIEDVSRDSRFLRTRVAAKEALSAACAFPIITGSELIGVLEFFNHEIRQPDEALLNMMMTVSRQIGLFMERLRAEEERGHLLVREREARRQAEEANRLKDEFLATLSHELRTPLTAIIGWAHLLRSGRLDHAATERALETIERNAKAQTQLTDDLLEVSRIITGKIRLEFNPVELAAIAESVVESMRPAASAKGIRLHLLLDSEVGLISGDDDRLRQIIWNLLSNAVKFTPKGGRVEVSLRRINSHVELTVSDTGAGISAEFLPHVFDRFRQADSSTTREFGGLGLGLAIVRQLAELHGGTVRAESPGEGQGARFTVTLPLMVVRMERRDHAQPENAEASGTTLECPPQLNGLRVLVVEDEEDAREMLAAALGHCGAEVAVVGSTNEALREFESRRPDILVSDIGMPEEDGYKLIRRVRRLPPERGGQIPAIALTAYARTEDRMRSLLAGFQVHLSKPVELNELIAVIASLAGRTGQS
jgi:PAS domain S-box-containing protein